MPPPSRRLLWILILVGVAAAALALVPRVRAEQAGRHVDIVLDYYALEDLCQSEGADFQATLERFRQAGVTSLSYSEQQLAHLVSTGRLACYNDGDFVRALRSRRELLPVGVPSAEAVNSGGPGSDPARPRVQPGRLYLVSGDPRMLQALHEWLGLILGKDRVAPWPNLDPGQWSRVSSSQPGVLQVASSEKALSASGMGFLPSDLEQARKKRLGVWVRPENRGHFQPADIERYFQMLASTPDSPVRGVIFEGLANEVMGFPDALDTTVDSLRQHKILFGNIEVPTVDAAQKGSRTLGLKLSDRTVRVMSVSSAQQLKLTPADAIDKFELGVRERNIRVVYARFFANADPGKSLVDTNVEYLALLSKTLREAGYVNSWASPLPALAPLGILVVLIALGVTAATVLTARELLPIASRLEWAALAASLVLSSGLVLIHKPLLWSWALVASLVFPVLGMALVLPQLGRLSPQDTAATVLRKSIGWLLWMTAITMAGSVCVAGVQASTTYMLSVEQFRGIKAVMVGVPLLVLVQFLTRSAPQPRTLGHILGKPVAFWHLGALAVLAAAAVFYIARTGNTAPGAASDSERVVRTFLENLLVVRPRFKEFAFAWPAWTAACVLAWRGRASGALWLLVLATAVGQADVIDTFAHIHTPFLISLLRIVNGLWLGIAVSVVTALAIMRLTGRGESEAPPRTHQGSLTPPAA